MLRDVGARDLWDDSEPEACFLWTFTFPDEETRSSPRLAAACWRSMMQDKRFAGRVFVHSFERAPRTGYCHFHAVTPEYWDVSDLREIAEHHGFGRLNVAKIPLEKAEYIAKYLAKDFPDLPAGMRKWACHGFKGSKTSDIKINKSVDTVTQDDLWSGQLWDGVLWENPDKSTVLVEHRIHQGGPPPNYKIMTLKPHALKEIVAAVEAGKFVGVGEYRGCAVRKQDVTDKKTFQVQKRLIVEHTVEFGTASVKIAEWLPVGASEDVKPAADKGAPVFCSILEISRQYGLKCEFIKPLSTLV